jgi:hypothetical protein
MNLKQVTVSVKNDVIAAMIVKKYLERAGYKIAGVKGGLTKASLQLIVNNNAEAIPARTEMASTMSI